MAADVLIALLVCACCGYAAWKDDGAERIAAILLVCGVVLAQTSNFVFAAPFSACAFYALWKGGAPERIAAAIFVVAVVLTHYAGSSLGPGRWTSVEIGILVVDVAALTGWGLVALYAERFWPIWFTALHAIAVAGHAVKMADPELMRWGYAFAIAFWSYPMLLLLAGGTWRHRRRLARDGHDRDWSGPFLGRGSARRVEAAG